ncbi:Retrovirus-related Pol polyprotein from transposon 17.6, partial [Mucuna pruriens]
MRQLLGGMKPKNHGWLVTSTLRLKGRGGSTSSTMKNYLRMINNIHSRTDKARRKLPPITFINQDFVGVDPEQNDPMVITVEVANFAMRKLQIPESKIKSYHEQLVSFLGERVDTQGYIDLLTMFGDEKAMKMTSICLHTTFGNEVFLLHLANIIRHAGIDPNFLCHRLALCAKAKLVAQKKRKTGEREKEARFIKEVDYTTWLSDAILVKKCNGKWKMCVDYTYRNKACPKNSYPLSSIDKLVNGKFGFKVLNFLDVCSNYNQIKMYSLDEEKIVLMTYGPNYCYRAMPFGLKSAGATYQRLMDKVFPNQIRKNLEVYVDDMVVNISPKQHIQDLEEIFTQVRKYNMRLNLDKYVLRVQGGKFLGFMLTHRGIEANPNKCETIINMKIPQNMKEVHKLIGQLVHYLGILRLQRIPSFPPVLAKPLEGHKLYLYLTVFEYAISVVMVQEQGKKQIFIYCINKLLQEAETRYQMIEKPVLTLVTLARRLRPYFQSHTIIVQTYHPIRLVLRKFELAGRMITWLIELSEFSLKFEPRGALKSKALADFIIEMLVKFEWRRSRHHFRGTEAVEYEALLIGLGLAYEVGVRRFEKSDVKHIPSQDNTQADVLSKLATTKTNQHRLIFYKTMKSPTIEEVRVANEEVVD